jgi:nitrate/TMAO reductase-like tetraheme cytochrome c subunit
MKAKIKYILWVMAGVILGIPLFSLTYSVMVRTSSPQWCSICHEIRPAYASWLTSSHHYNEYGVVARCMDCHLPPAEHLWSFFYGKTLHGAKDITVHLLGKEYNREGNRRKAYKSIDNASCMKCHSNLIYSPMSRGAMLAHRTVLYPRRGYEKRCLDCHQHLVHTDRALYERGT